MTDRRIARYYDRLHRWNGVAHALGYGGGRGRLTVHRALADPAARGRATTSRLHDVLIEALPPLEAPRVLDAGCGLGGTMLELAQRLHAQCVGLTLSHGQAATASRAARDAGCESAVRVLVQSYDTPPDGPFDLIVAIESLAHSPSPEVSVRALARVLAPGGLLVVVDDMPEPAAGRSSAQSSAQSSGQGADQTDDLTRFKAGWRCPVLWSRAAYLAAFVDLGLELVVDRDLTQDARPRPLWRIRALESVNRVVHRTVPSGALGEVLDSHLAGLALERLTRRGVMHYRLLIARRSMHGL